MNAAMMSVGSSLSGSSSFSMSCEKTIRQSWSKREDINRLRSVSKSESNQWWGSLSGPRIWSMSRYGFARYQAVGSRSLR